MALRAVRTALLGLVRTNASEPHFVTDNVSSRGKILLVDHDPSAMRAVTARLEERGFEIVARKSTRGTSSAVMAERPDVVLLNMHMPDLSGDWIARLLTAVVPVILYGPAVSHAKGKELKAIGVIAKTEDDDDFVRQFERLFVSIPASPFG